MSNHTQVIQPQGWARPKGYANGVVGSGRTLWVGGQIGWGPDQQKVSDDFVPQFAQALDNVLAVVHAAGGSPEHLVSMTIFVTDLDAYRSSGKAIGEVWKTRIGKHFPAMALVGVAGLVEPWARVEICAIACLPA